MLINYQVKKMPNCFQLISRSTNQPEPFVEINRKICQHLGEVQQNDEWCRDWYPYIGFLLASGQKIASDELKEKVAKIYQSLVPVVEFLAENYNSVSWYER